MSWFRGDFGNKRGVRKKYAKNIIPRFKTMFRIQNL
jgi:hypothetical protein